MKLKSGMWNADVDFDLAAFHSLVRLAHRQDSFGVGEFRKQKARSQVSPSRGSRLYGPRPPRHQ